jgi:Ca2+-binding EF-hand superfamily protein
MSSRFLACAACVGLFAGDLAGQERNRSDQGAGQPTTVTITRIDPLKGEMEVRYKDGNGNAQTKVLRLNSEVRLLDETGRPVRVDAFESGSDALVVEKGGKLHEVRRAIQRALNRNLSDAVKSLIEMTDCEQDNSKDLQEIQEVYDTLRKLDPDKTGRIDPKALKTEAEQILHDRVQRAFQRLDKNGDGKISMDEARGLIKEHFGKIDTNKDGSISFDELMAAAREHCEQKAAGHTRAMEHRQMEKEH